MGTLKERDAWVTPVYEIERADPLMGGEHGINNLQAHQLGDRTRWLKTRLEAGHDASGGHSLSERDVAEDAAIPEDRLALDYATAALRNENAAHAAAVEGIARALHEAEGGPDTPLDALYRGLMLSWRYGDERFAFELFSDGYTFREPVDGSALRECIAGDDSVDIADTSVLAVSEPYVLVDEDGGQAEAITVAAVLTPHRFLSSEPVTISRKGGRISRTSWNISAGAALAPQNGMLHSRLLDVCHGFDLARLTIAHEAEATFKVERRAKLNEAWQPCECLGVALGADGLRRTRFRMAGGRMYLRVTALDAVRVRHIALTPAPECRYALRVRTPVASGRFRLSRFGALYGAGHAATEILLSRSSDFAQAQTIRLPALPCLPEDKTIVDASAEVRRRVELGSGAWWWKARYQSTHGHWSLWSAAGIAAGD